MPVVWRAVDVAIVVLAIGTGVGLLLHVWCRQCSAAHVRALRSDDDASLRVRWSRWRRDTRVQYSRLPV
jgi:hypothetical protein